MRAWGEARLGRATEKGSVLMLVLFMCLAIAVLVQTVAAVTWCAQRMLADENAGRSRMARLDDGLAELRARATTEWKTGAWTVGGGADVQVQGSLFEIGSSGWMMATSASLSEAAIRMHASAWMERGRDGVDLPLAALVAGSLAVSPGRTSNCVGSDGETQDLSPALYVAQPDIGPPLTAGCASHLLDAPWRLDPGWQVLAQPVSGPQGPGDCEDPAVATVSLGAAAGPRVLLLRGRGGEVLDLADHLGSLSAGGPVAVSPGGEVESAVLVLVTGGAELDARDLDDFYGVIVVDEGSILLDGTILHGALFVTNTVDLGGSGRLLFSRRILRWATDRSLGRTRLVPGTRSEGTE